MNFQEKVEELVRLNNGIYVDVKAKTNVGYASIKKMLKGVRCENVILKRLHEAYPDLGFDKEFLVKKCEKCGKEFIPDRNTKKTCYKESGNYEKSRYKKMVLKQPEISIGNEERQAREKGLTYGQFVALRRMARV